APQTYIYQAEDDIRDRNVTGVQTCALPIYDAGIADDQLINMFDYFQGALQIEPKKLQVQDIEFGALNIKFADDAEKSRYLVKSNEQLVARVNYNVDADRQVKSVEWFDGFNNLYRVDHR